jgi:pimeloyl-ACP methyl ester carboxylesterase
MATIVVAHGAWSSAWAWKKMRPLLRAAGHELWTPSYTGLGERAHLARPEIDLSTHIQDVIAVLEAEDLSDVTLIGHSYGGMVATGIVDQAPGRIARTIYLDAFAPKDGESLFDLTGPKAERNMRGGAERDGEGWRIPSGPMPPDTSPKDVAWATPRRHMQPLKTFEQKLTIAREVTAPRHYIYATRFGPGDVFRQFGTRAQAEPGWKYYELDSSHNPHITCPEALRDLLLSIMAGS